MNLKRTVALLLPLSYALGAMLLFAVLVRMTFFVSFRFFGLSEEGHGALSNGKTFINTIFDLMLVFFVIALYRWSKIPGLKTPGFKFSGVDVRITLVCLVILFTQYFLIIFSTSSTGTIWIPADVNMSSVVRAVILMLGVGIGEEVFFRAGVFKLLKPYNRPAAYLMGGLIFAGAHFFA